MLQLDLAPKSTGALLDDALALYRANVRTLLTVSGIVLFPLALIMTIAQVLYTRGFFEIMGQVLDSSTDPDAFLEAFAPAQTAYLAAATASPLYYAAQAIFAVAVIMAASSFIYGRRLGWRETWWPGWKPVLKYVSVAMLMSAGAVVVVLAGAVTVVGLLAVPFVLVYLGMRLAVAPVAVVAEDCPIPEAIRRSWTLTRGSFWRTLGFFIALGVVSTGISAAVAAPSAVRQIVASIQNPDAVFQPLSVGWKTLEGFLGAAAIAAVAPFNSLSLYRYYLDLRARKEGMDLIVRAQELASDDAP